MVLAVGGVMPGESTLASVGAEAEAAAVTGGKVVVAELRGEQEASAAMHMTEGADTVVNAGKKSFENSASATNNASKSGIPEDSIEIKPVGAAVSAPPKYKVFQAPNGDRFYQSPNGLIYGPGSTHGDRMCHVLEHTQPNPSKTTYTVFNAQGDQALALVDEAWANKGASVPGDPGDYVVPMGRVVGTAGETSIRIVVKPSTSEIITAYPQ